MIYTCAFPTVRCQNVFCEKGLFTCSGEQTCLDDNIAWLSGSFCPYEINIKTEAFDTGRGAVVVPIVPI